MRLSVLLCAAGIACSAAIISDERSSGAEPDSALRAEDDDNSEISNARGPAGKRIVPDPEIQERVDRILTVVFDEKVRGESYLKTAFEQLEEDYKDRRDHLLRQLLYYRSRLPRGYRKLVMLAMISEIDADLLGRAFTVADYLAEADPELRRDLIAWMGGPAPITRSLPAEFWVAEYLSQRKENPPLGFLAEYYERATDAMLYTMFRAYAEDDHAMAQVVRPAEHEITGVLLKQRFGVLPPDQATPEALEQWDKLARHDQWWVRAYAAVIMRQHPEFRVPALVRALQDDEHPLVRAAATFDASEARLVEMIDDPAAKRLELDPELYRRIAEIAVDIGVGGDEQTAFERFARVQEEYRERPEELLRQILYARSRSDSLALDQILNVLASRVPLDFKETVAALADYFLLAEPSLREEFLNWIGVPASSVASPRAAAGGSFRLFLEIRRDDPPLGYLRELYLNSPGVMVLTMLLLYGQDDAETVKAVRLGEHSITGVLLKQEFDLLPKDQATPEALEHIENLARHEAWWVRAYAASIIRREPEFRVPELMPLLRADPHRVVREIMDFDPPVNQPLSRAPRPHRHKAGPRARSQSPPTAHDRRVVAWTKAHATYD